MDGNDDEEERNVCGDRGKNMVRSDERGMIQSTQVVRSNLMAYATKQTTDDQLTKTMTDEEEANVCGGADVGGDLNVVRSEPGMIQSAT